MKPFFPQNITNRIVFQIFETEKCPAVRNKKRVKRQVKIITYDIWGRGGGIKALSIRTYTSANIYIYIC